MFLFFGSCWDFDSITLFVHRMWMWFDRWSHKVTNSSKPLRHRSFYLSPITQEMMLCLHLLTRHPPLWLNHSRLTPQLQPRFPQTARPRLSRLFSSLPLPASLTKFLQTLQTQPIQGHLIRPLKKLEAPWLCVRPSTSATKGETVKSDRPWWRLHLLTNQCSCLNSPAGRHLSGLVLVRLDTPQCNQSKKNSICLYMIYLAENQSNKLLFSFSLMAVYNLC